MDTDRCRHGDCKDMRVLETRVLTVVVMLVVPLIRVLVIIQV